MVREKRTNRVVQGPGFQHHVVLMGIYADSKARIKLANTLSQSAYLGCGYCWLTGVYADAMRFAGYAAPVTCCMGPLGPKPAQNGVPAVPAQSVLMCDDDARLRLTHQHHVDRGVALDRMHDDAAAAQRADPQAKVEPPPVEVFGAHRSCIFAQMLWYVDLTVLFLVPFGHTYFRGVLKNFCDQITESPASLSGEAAAAGVYQEAYVAELGRRAEQAAEEARRAEVCVCVRDQEQPMCKHAFVCAWLRLACTCSHYQHAALLIPVLT